MSYLDVFLTGFLFLCGVFFLFFSLVFFLPVFKNVQEEVGLKRLHMHGPYCIRVPLGIAAHAHASFPTFVPPAELPHHRSS